MENNYVNHDLSESRQNDNQQDPNIEKRIKLNENTIQECVDDFDKKGYFIIDQGHDIEYQKQTKDVMLDIFQESRR